MEFKDWYKEYKKAEGKRPTSRQVWNAAQRHGTDINNLKAEIKVIMDKADYWNSKGISYDVLYDQMKTIGKLIK